MADDQSNNSDSSDGEVTDFELEKIAKYDRRCLAISYRQSWWWLDFILWKIKSHAHAKLRDFTTDKTVLSLMAKIDSLC